MIEGNQIVSDEVNYVDSTASDLEEGADGAKYLDAMVSDLMEMSDVTKAVLKELKNITLRYVRKMRVMPYPDHDFNSYPFMSTIIAEELFTYSIEHPKKEFKIFTGDVKSEFYGDGWLFNRINDLAMKGIKFDIILAKPPTSESLHKWQKLAKRFPNHIKVGMKPKYNNKLCHLMLVWDAYRIEAPHDDYDGKVTELYPLRPARFGFHDSTYARDEVLRRWETEVAIDDVEPLPMI